MLREIVYSLEMVLQLPLMWWSRLYILLGPWFSRLLLNQMREVLFWIFFSLLLSVSYLAESFWSHLSLLTASLGLDQSWLDLLLAIWCERNWKYDSLFYLIGMCVKRQMANWKRTLNIEVVRNAYSNRFITIYESLLYFRKKLRKYLSIWTETKCICSLTLFKMFLKSLMRLVMVLSLFLVIFNFVHVYTTISKSEYYLQSTSLCFVIQ